MIRYKIGQFERQMGIFRVCFNMWDIRGQRYQRHMFMWSWDTISALHHGGSTMYHCSWRRLGHTRHLKRSIGKWSQESCPERLRLLKTGKKNSLLLISWLDLGGYYLYCQVREHYLGVILTTVSPLERLCFNQLHERRSMQQRMWISIRTPC